MEILPFVQNYDWGKPFDTSIVAKLYELSNPTLNKNVPFAELWMGTHPNGPSIFTKTKESLSEVLKNHPDYLGVSSVQVFGNNLPFLFKVLSVNKALSIQVHPSKEHAEELHKLRPDLYKDPNHKPELAIALTDFEALCGFRPLSEIEHFFRNVPELTEVVGKDLVELLNKANKTEKEVCLKNCFRSLMMCDEEKIKIALQKLLSRFSTLDPSSNIQLRDVVERLNSQFPNDVGCFVPYFLNILELHPGEAIYLGPGMPHAYLSGDCVECMACSDNVVRAGLTPKFKDVETLCDMLIYKGEPSHKKLFKPIIEDQYTSLFKPPVPDFAVAKIEINKPKNVFDLIKRKTASIIICIEGKGSCGDILLEPGKVFFVPANDAVKILNIQGKLLLFQAMTNV